MGLQRLYPSHIPLGWTEKLLATAGASLGAFFSPQRADLVAAVGELTGESALKEVRKRMHNDPTGRTILQERPIVSVRHKDPSSRSFLYTLTLRCFCKELRQGLSIEETRAL